MIDATLQLEAWDNVFLVRDEPRSALAGVPQALAEAIVDSVLIETVRRALHETGYLELRNLSITISDDWLSLDGRVPSYHLKQLAQAAATHVPGIGCIVNTVEVVNGR